MADFPAIEVPQQIRQADTPEPGLPARPDLPDRGGLPALPGRREIKPRHAFDIYKDQVEALQQLALEDRMRGGVGSQSAMVREAIDDYIAKVRGK